MLSLCLRTVPTFLNKFTYKCFYNLLFHLLKMSRNVVMQNLEKAFPGKEKSWYNRIAAQCYKFYVDDFSDFLSFPLPYLFKIP